MSDAYGWNGGGRKVFDAALLEQAAAELRRTNTGPELQRGLEQALPPREAFGTIPGAAAAYQRLATAFAGLQAELANVGVDLTDLASRTSAAAQMADQAERATWAAARARW